ncbi:hypothetical protein J6590_028504 [Homalodisca vitripennis]|nr:hypothetical protein J6590_028504 [Homalodisca vitripennis]
MCENSENLLVLNACLVVANWAPNARCLQGLTHKGICAHINTLRAHSTTGPVNSVRVSLKRLLCAKTVMCNSTFNSFKDDSAESSSNNNPLAANLRVTWQCRGDRNLRISSKVQHLNTGRVGTIVLRGGARKHNIFGQSHERDKL